MIAALPTELIERVVEHVETLLAVRLSGKLLCVELRESSSKVNGAKVLSKLRDYVVSKNMWAWSVAMGAPWLENTDILLALIKRADVEGVKRMWMEPSACWVKLSRPSTARCFDIPRLSFSIARSGSEEMLTWFKDKSPIHAPTLLLNARTNAFLLQAMSTLPPAISITGLLCDQLICAVFDREDVLRTLKALMNFHFTRTWLHQHAFLLLTSADNEAVQDFLIESTTIDQTVAASIFTMVASNTNLTRFINVLRTKGFKPTAQVSIDVIEEASSDGEAHAFLTRASTLGYPVDTESVSLVCQDRGFHQTLEWLEKTV